MGTETETKTETATSVATDTTTPTSALQFDTVQPAEGNWDALRASTCASCSAALVDSYYEAGGRVLCAPCATKLGQAGGSPVGRFFRALGLGVGAALLGFGVYYLVSLTGYQFGLIAVVVGFLVGFAVRMGTGGRGGRLYQVMAAVLTYLAIVCTYVPPIADAILHPTDDAGATSGDEGGAGTEARADPLEAATGGPQEVPDGVTAPAVTPGASGDDAPLREPGVVGYIFVYIISFFLALAAPFLSGLEGILGILILAFGIWEAWRINRRSDTVVEGPFPLTRAAPAAPAEPPAPLL